MNQLTEQELVETAAAYDTLLAPALFQAWTDRVLEAAAVGPGQRVLDVACGTGVLARRAAARVGPAGSVSGVDINPAMLAVAQSLAPEIDWRQGPAESLPHEDQGFDAVVCQFGLMLFSDPAAAASEMLRVLKPGGRVAVAVFDALENIPAYEAMAEVYERVVGRDVADTLRFPFSMGDQDRLLGLFDAAGAASPEIRTQRAFACFDNVRSMVMADVRGWFPFAQIALEDAQIEGVVTEAEQALGPFRTADGQVEFAVPVHIVTATRP